LPESSQKETTSSINSAQLCSGFGWSNIQERMISYFSLFLVFFYTVSTGYQRMTDYERNRSITGDIFLIALLCHHPIFFWGINGCPYSHNLTVNGIGWITFAERGASNRSSMQARKKKTTRSEIFERFIVQWFL